MSKRRIGSVALAVAIAAVLLVLALRGVDWQEVARTIAGADPLWLLAAFGVYTLSMLLRALRWRVLLTAGGEVSHATAFWANEAGYLGNYVLPARAGELIRSGLIARRTGLAMAFVLATALAERVLDAAILVAMALSAVALLGEIPPAIRAAAQSTAIAVAIGAAALVAAPQLQGVVLGLLRRSPVLPRAANVVADQAERFLAGMAPVRQPGRIGRFLALAAAIWLLDAVAAIGIGLALGLELSLPLALLLLASLGLSSAVPSTPGYVGVYQFVAVAVLTPFGHSPSEAIAYIVVLQALTYALVILWGSIGVWRLGGWWTKAS